MSGKTRNGKPAVFNDFYFNVHVIDLLFITCSKSSCSPSIISTKCHVHGVEVVLRSENIKKVNDQELAVAVDRGRKKNPDPGNTKNVKENSVKGKGRKERGLDHQVKRGEENDLALGLIDPVQKFLRSTYLAGTSVVEMQQKKQRGKKRKKGGQKWKGKGKCKQNGVIKIGIRLSS